jgi:glucose-6-phosphate 1-dehydrogenase
MERLLGGNPLAEGLVGDRQPEPCAMVIFGASGDLTRRKLVPALYSLARERLLPSGFAIVGMARRPLAFAADMREAVGQFARRRPVDDALWESFGGAISYVSGDFDDPAAYERLRVHLDEIDLARGTRGNRVFYISTPPESFETILRQLGKARLISPSERPFTRVILEKPFGRDLDTAIDLNRRLLDVFREHEIYRIDHYLGKETVQNVLVLRFANSIFEPLWNHRYIDHVQISVAETLGVEGRGGYYEESGALRDMVQNHILQLLCLVAMEPPAALDPESIRDERRKVLRSIRPIQRDDVDLFAVRGQYGPGSIGGARVPGYREEPSVKPNSRTETYAAVRFDIDNWRWAGVPFYLRTGKRLPKKVSEVAIVFRDIPHRLFDAQGPTELDANVLSLRIQPDEGIALKFGTKVPGFDMRVRPVKMDFQYGAAFGVAPPEAYERLLLDAMLGDPTLFARGDEVMASWRYCDRILRGWAERDAHSQAVLPSYEPGTWGPDASVNMLARDGRVWRRP